jgi:hypothetical protein
MAESKKERPHARDQILSAKFVGEAEAIRVKNPIILQLNSIPF